MIIGLIIVAVLGTILWLLIRSFMKEETKKDESTLVIKAHFGVSTKPSEESLDEKMFRHNRDVAKAYEHRSVYSTPSPRPNTSRNSVSSRYEPRCDDDSAYRRRSDNDDWVIPAIVVASSISDDSPSSSSHSSSSHSDSSSSDCGSSSSDSGGGDCGGGSD